MWDLLLKMAGIVVPVFTGLTMFGVGYMLSLANGAKREVAMVREELRGLTEALTVRVEVSRRDHDVIDRRLSDHDERLQNHDGRIQKLEDVRA